MRARVNRPSLVDTRDHAGEGLPILTDAGVLFLGLGLDGGGDAGAVLELGVGGGGGDGAPRLTAGTKGNSQKATKHQSKIETFHKGCYFKYKIKMQNDRILQAELNSAAIDKVYNRPDNIRRQ